MGDFRYKAFISYSWADAAWGKWAHHALETYRTPKALIGKETAIGPVPATLHPLFKDREEEAAGASIGAAVETALGASEFLIVICSPRSAQSQWVNREVAWFKTHRDPANILALIVDGEPGGAEDECFPAALTHNVLPDLTVTHERHDAPLAADARDSGDGKRHAKLKLAAAMLGIGLDELVRRDEKRRALRTRIIVGASLSLAVVMSGLTAFAIQARNEAEYQRAESDGLVEFMLTDLREKLEPVGRLDALDVVGQRALKYYAGQKPGNLDANALGRRSRALHLVGEIRNIRGDSVAGLLAFRQAAETTKELLARDPDNAQRNFDHAQSVFWVGYIAYERGEAKEAEAQFREYKRIADRLITLDPKKPEWQLEMSYAETNLGVLYYEQGRYAEAAKAFANGLKMVKAVAAREKPDSARQLEVGQAINWLGKARSALNQMADAIALHREEIALYQNILKSDPGNTDAKMLMAVAWQHVGRLEQTQGSSARAIDAFATSLELMKALRAIEPGNMEWRETEIRGQLAQFDNLLFTGQPAKARAMLQTATDGIGGLVAADPKNAVWTVGLRSTADNRAALIALTDRRHDAAFGFADRIDRRLQANPDFDPSETVALRALAGIYAGDALAATGKKAEAAARWQTTLDAIEKSPAANRLQIRRARYLLLKRLGQRKLAADAAAELDRQGDRHPAYLRER